MLAVDISNYSTPIRRQQVTSWQASGVGLVVVQGWPGEVRDQLAVLSAAGMPTDGYVFVYPGDTPALIQQRLSLFDGYVIRRLWLDVEIDGLTLATVQMALTTCDRYPTRLNPTGIYTAFWYWPSHMANYRGFSDRLLWDANYDARPDAAANFRPYGGWTHAAIKQYRGTSTLAGVGNVDLDVLSAEEVGQLGSAQEAPSSMAISVGQGMLERMQQSGDAPLFGHKFYAEVDDSGATYSVEECYGSKGRYVSSNSSGAWINAGPF